MTTTEIKLTDEQQAVVEYCTRGDQQVVRMGGFAGTGKSTVLVEVHRALPTHAVCAYTGKAVNVLRRKGIAQASTIHSLIYVPEDDGAGGVEWRLREPHELFVDGFLVDEASMVSRDIDRDLRTFGLPIVYVGDHGQLEPVGSSGEEGFSLMRDPDVSLEKIHRNAGEIARFAEHLRGGGEASEWDDVRKRWAGLNSHHAKEMSADQVQIITGEQLADVDMSAQDQIVCAFNRTRCSLNAAVREHLGHEHGLPVVGNRVICLQNVRQLGLFNGMQGVLTSVNRGSRRLSFTDEDGREYANVRYVADAFGSEKTPKRERGSEAVPFDWAYCVTCHKMQGSEADSVLVLEQRCGAWEHPRWAYTAASRAKKRLTWVLE